MALESGINLNNRYRILTVLGQGGMGAVYHAFDMNLGVDVAVKENLYLSDEYARQFKREATILASLKHPNLPRVSDHFEIENQGQYLVMDYIDGEDLRQRMERVGVLPEPEVIRVGATVCEAVGYLHQRFPPIVHRDIKPGNIKITSDGKIFLVDFGLAKIHVEDQETTTGARAMTPGFSPPEQYGTARTDPRSDIFSLGATLYATLTGYAPEDSLSRATGYSALTAIREHNPQVGRKLAQAIEKSLAVKPDDRYQTAEAFRTALLVAGGLESGESKELTIAPPPKTTPLKPGKGKVLRPPPDTTLQTRKKRKRNVAGLAAAAVVFVIALVSIIIYLMQVQPGSDADQIKTLMSVPTDSEVVAIGTPIPEVSQPTQTMTSEAVSPTDTAEKPLVTQKPIPVSATPQPVTQSTPLPVILPQATPYGGSGMIAFVSNRTKLPQIYTMDVITGETRQITDLKLGACQPEWSPDGNQIIFTSPCLKRDYTYPKGMLYIMNADGSNLTAPEVGIGGSYDPAWSPDGQWIAYTKVIQKITQIYLIKLSTKEIRALTSADEASHQPTWSPDGSKVAFIRDSHNSEVWEIDINTMAERQLTYTQRYSNTFPVYTPDGTSVYFSQGFIDKQIPWLAAIIPSSTGDFTEIRIPIENYPVPEPAADLDISPDGFQAIFEAWPEYGNHDIFLMEISGRGVIRLTRGLGLNWHPTWKPVSTN